MENARRNYERYRQLVKEGIVTEEQAEGYRTTAESAAATMAAGQAEVENARAQLSFCTITAPVSGRLGQLAVDKGNVVKANETALVTINKLTPIHANFTVPEKELPEIKRHMSMGVVEIAASIPDAAEIREKGVLTFIDNSVDPTTGTIRLKGTFENRQKHLWPGQFVNLSLILSIRKNAVVVPSQAVQIGQKGQFVFVVKPDTTAEMRTVTTGPVANGITIVDAGLQPGEQVVGDGHMRVIPGGKVDIKQPEKPVAPAGGSAGADGANGKDTAVVK
jgi:multidrug efflux system membrane fusion protein